MTTPCTKWNYQITCAEEIPEVISKAFYIANSGRPGPVVLMITKNAQFAELEFEYKKTTFMNSYKPENYLDFNKIKQAANLINKAKKPFLLFGQGVILSGAEKELQAFVEKTGIPAASTLLGLSALPSDHPNFVGMLGMHGNYGPNLLTNECDVLIGVGLRFDDRVTGDASRYAKQAKIIHIELDKSELGKIVDAEVPIAGDAREVLDALIPLVNPSSHDKWMNKFKSCDKQEFDEVMKKELDQNKDKLGMAYVCKLLSDLTDHDAILVTDVGQHQMVGNRYFKFKNTRSVVTSGGLGTMGFALPAAMGAKLGCPERTVVSISGDGGFQMTMQELGTIAQYQIPVKMVILNNHFLGMVRQWQELFFKKRYSFTKIESPDYVQIASAYNIPAWSVSDGEELKIKINEMLNTKGPALLEVKVEQEDNVFPMVPSGAAVNEVILKP
jgi:acetolactate synthase-1/2/3 large subunit